MTHVYQTTGGWNIEVEYSYHEGVTSPGGEDPESLEISRASIPIFGPVFGEIAVRNLCKAFMIDFEDIELEILDENR